MSTFRASNENTGVSEDLLYENTKKAPAGAFFFISMRGVALRRYCFCVNHANPAYQKYIFSHIYTLLYKPSTNTPFAKYHTLCDKVSHFAGENAILY